MAEPACTINNRRLFPWVFLSLLLPFFGKAAQPGGFLDRKETLGCLNSAVGHLFLDSLTAPSLDSFGFFFIPFHLRFFLLVMGYKGALSGRISADGARSRVGSTAFLNPFTQHTTNTDTILRCIISTIHNHCLTRKK